MTYYLEREENAPLLRTYYVYHVYNAVYAFFHNLQKERNSTARPSTHAHTIKTDFSQNIYSVGHTDISILINLMLFLLFH